MSGLPGGAGAAASAGSVIHRFGAAVRHLRESHGWSQEQLAGRAELNRSYVGEVERGDAVPSLATVEKIAQALRLSPSALIGRCEAPFHRSVDAEAG